MAGAHPQDGAAATGGGLDGEVGAVVLTALAQSLQAVTVSGAGDGHGLEGLRQRCQDNGADLTIEAPSDGSGTVLRVSARRLSSRMTHDATE